MVKIKQKDGSIIEKRIITCNEWDKMVKANSMLKEDIEELNKDIKISEELLYWKEKTEKLSDKQIELLKKNISVLEDKVNKPHEYNSCKRDLLIFDKDYDYRKDDRWKNTIALFDELWHWDNEGSDGCPKCEWYVEVLYQAFNKISQLSDRNLDELTNFKRKDIQDTQEELRISKWEKTDVDKQLKNLKGKTTSQLIWERLPKGFTNLFTYRLKLTKENK